MDKFNFILKNDKLNELVNCISDLTKISDIVKMKIDKDDIFIYSLVGETSITAFKNFTLKTDDYIESKTEIDKPFEYIILESKKFVKNIRFLIESEDKIKCTFSYLNRGEPSNYVRGFKLSDGKFKFTIMGGENYKIREINKEMLSGILNEDNIEWSFQINRSDYASIKKLATINNDRDIIDINCKGGSVVFGEDTKWEVKVCDIEANHSEITFPKKYLTSISNTDDVINFHVYETFLLFKEDGVNLMVSFEQDFSTEEL